MEHNTLNIQDLNQVRSAYIIGIGGISMSALAMMLLQKGIKVRGYDRTPSPVTKELEEAGIRVYYEDCEDAFDGIDLVCYTAAVDAEHPQMRLAAKCGARIISRAELLECIASTYANAIAVAGTHGKSTTSGMLSHLFLKSPRFDPTIAVGAKVCGIDSTYRVGNDEHFIFEACEYKDSFLSFYPRVAVVLNIQLDHTDYFHSMEQMLGSFVQFMHNAGKSGINILNYDCENCRIAANQCECNLITFSVSGDERATYYAKNIDLSDGFGAFDIYYQNAFLLHTKLSVPGIHNVSNALAATAAAICSGMTAEEISDGLATYTGVSRRFEFLCQRNGVRYFDDYAHHPDEIRVTLAAAKAITKGKVICVFQPHNYSRLRDLFEDFCTSFADADLLVLTKLYAAREAAGDEVSSALLAERTNAQYIEDMDDILPYLEQICTEGDTVLIMGAGNIAKVADFLKKSKKSLDK